MAQDTDTYEVMAKYYDGAYAAKKDLVDVPFYVELAKGMGGPVLEIACGTGRVLLPIAREGIEIHGVDNSPAMLRILRAHLKEEPPKVASRFSSTRATCALSAWNANIRWPSFPSARCSTCIR
jgi:ubiquinone/menaquinone biosynthesis C-methylase UbiE